MLSFGILVTAIIAVVAQQTAGQLRRVCYYSNWAQYRPSAGKFVPENVDPNLCTHYIYAFATLQGNNIKAFEWNDESTAWSKGMYERFQALKQQNPAMKTLLAIGGWNMASGPFTSMVATSQSRAQFIQSAVDFLRKNGFDGLDVDWEYPANRGSPATDRDRFTDLIRELRAKFDAEAAATGQPKLLLSAAVGAGKDKIDTAYDIPQLNRYLDFINLMTYDLHGSWESFTGHHTALYPRASETGDQRYLNVDFAARYWVQKGATPSKLNIGVGTFGRSFTLVNPSQNGLAASARNAGNAGQYTRENGFLSYYEVCRLNQNGGQVHDDPEQAVRYVTKGDQWVGAEDEQTMAEKACYIKQNGYGGVMVWAIDLDDFSGNFCGKGPYPLLHAINNELNNPGFSNCPKPGAPVQQPSQGPPVGFPTQPPYVPQTAPAAVYITQGVQGPQTPAATGGPTQAWVPFPGVFSNTGTPAKPQGPVTPGQTQPPYYPQQTNYVPPQTPKPTVNSNTPVQQISQRGFNCMNLPSDFYPNVYACDEYFICANQVSYRVRCAMGLQYNPASKHCDWPSNVHCVNLHTTPQQQPNGGVYTPPPGQPHTQRPAVYTQPPVQTQPPVYTPAPVQTHAPAVVFTQPPVVQTQPPVMPTQPPVVQTGVNAFCARRTDGAYRDPSDCSKYYMCSGGRGRMGVCPPGLAFNDAFALCQQPYFIQACRTLQG